MRSKRTGAARPHDADERIGGSPFLKFTAWGITGLGAVIIALYATYALYINYIRIAVPGLGVWIHDQIRVDAPLNAQGEIVYFYAPFAITILVTFGALAALIWFVWRWVARFVKRHVLPGMRRNGFHGPLLHRRYRSGHRPPSAGRAADDAAEGTGDAASRAWFVPGTGTVDRYGEPLDGIQDPMADACGKEAADER